MMRWLCYTLVVLNGLAFWVAANAPVSKPDAVALPNLPRVQVLRLVGEDQAPVRVPEEFTAGRDADACYLVGGFAAAEDVVVWREERGLSEADAEQVSRQIPLPPHYWVLVRPLETTGAARAKLAQLQKQGVDSYLIGSGEWRNGISLGLYESHAAAESRFGEAQRAGLDVVISQRSRSRIFHGLRGGELLRAAVSRDALDYRGRTLSLQYCEGVAKADKNP